MSKYWLTIGLVSFLLAGCGDDASEKASESDTNGTVEVQEQSSTTEAQETAPVNSEPTQAETAAPAAQGEVALNPPHGQPGHDCAIPVGAPLDGSGGQNTQAAQPTFNPPAPQQQPIMQVGSEGSARLNPPHGQPGHDCDVAVGAPLPAK